MYLFFPKTKVAITSTGDLRTERISKEDLLIGEVNVCKMLEKRYCMRISIAYFWVNELED